MFLQSFPDYSKSFGSPKLYLLSRNEVVAWRSKENKCRPHWLFYVVDGTRTAVKCTKMKIARAKSAKLLFLIIKYANLRQFCHSRRPACLSSIIIILVRSDCNAYSGGGGGEISCNCYPRGRTFCPVGKRLNARKINFSLWTVTLGSKTKESTRPSEMSSLR